MSIPAATAYWQIGGDTSQVWSSERVAYVPVDDPGYQAWLAAGNEVIVLASEADLNQVLNDVGLGHLAPKDLTTPSRNYKSLVRRRSEELAKQGKPVEALLLLRTIGE
jgi:hypothetical protein